MLKEKLLDLWFDNSNRNLYIVNYKQIRKKNLLECGDDPDINIKRRWGIRTNGAKRGNPEDTCLDWQLDLGHIHINYTNFKYNDKYR